jgi:Meckel syndrome type 1 protein
MSLIHEALREMDATTASRAPAAVRSLRPRHRDAAAFSSGPMVKAVLAVVAVLAGGGVAWWTMQGPAAPAIPATPAVQAPAAFVPPPVVTAQPMADAPPQAVVPVTSAKHVSNNSPVDLPPAAIYTRRAERPASPKPAPRKTQAAPAPAPEMTLEERHALLRKSVASGDLDSARAHLAALERALPADSIALLRVRAWYAAHAGNAAEARKAYEAVLERLPGDENAGLNLAALEAREGRSEAARILLAEVLQAHPESEAAQQALRRLKEGAR